ncbi:MAG TPA: hypothetical protein VGB78_01335 [Thermoplasmata archaeon]
MGLGKDIRDNWLSLAFFAAVSLTFLAFSVVSAYTYSNVVQAQTTIVLENPAQTATLLENGTLEVSFSMDLNNPSDYVLYATTVSWYAELDTYNGQLRTVIVGEDYSASGRETRIEADSVTALEFIDYLSPVEDPEKYTQLTNFINYTAGQGEDYTLETLPYRHELTVVLRIDDFRNDFLRDFYLNQLVTVELYYNSEADQ